ncbi:MAG: DUF2225 domain-containing protein [Clostridiales bacterium]|nr:DUF2225 domain-containing protein [Clostridiales bacterium]
MADLFSGLESMGLDKLKNMDVYESADTKKQETIAQQVQVTEADLIFDKTYKCPVCDKEFKNKTVKTGKVKLVSADTDLRPKYHQVDCLKYDVIACPSCGYAALNRFFNYMTTAQARLIKESISANYKGGTPEGDIITYDEAINNHKLALVNAIVKKGKLSERAYTCLKTAWVIRGKRENLPEDTKDYETVKEDLVKQEQEFLLNAYEGFSQAFSKEMFPMCGMDELTITYLLADLARRVGKYEEASRYVSRVLTSREANDRIKEKARQIKEMIIEER